MTNGLDLIKYHSLALLGWFLCAIYILCHQILTDAYTPSNRRCIQFGVRKKNQRYSSRFWIFISKTLKRDVFIKRIPMDAFIVHLKIIALLLCGIKQTLIPQEGLPYSVALIGQTINAVVGKPNFCQFHNHSSSSSVIELPKYSRHLEIASSLFSSRTISAHRTSFCFMPLL